MEALAKVEHAHVAAEYFKSLVLALQSAIIYGRVVVTYLGWVDYPDLGAEMADILLRLRSVRWVTCIGTHKDLVMVSVRTRNRHGAGNLVQEIIGNRGTAGGHGAMAGGQIPIGDQDPVRLAKKLQKEALKHLRVLPEVAGEPLV